MRFNLSLLFAGTEYNIPEALVHLGSLISIKWGTFFASETPRSVAQLDLENDRSNVPKYTEARRIVLWAVFSLPTTINTQEHPSLLRTCLARPTIQTKQRSFPAYLLQVGCAGSPSSPFSPSSLALTYCDNPLPPSTTMPTHALIVAFDIIVLLSVVLNLAALVTAMLSKSIARSPIWYSMMTAGVVYSLSYGLLVGRQETPDEPPLGLCVTQTVLIYGVPVLSVLFIYRLFLKKESFY